MGRRLLRATVPGIVDVATRAGVSAATVSRYFNAPGIVRYATRKRIAEAVAALSYVPKGAARSLNRGASGTIGLIMPTTIFAELAQAFSTELFRHSRTMLIGAHGYDLAREAILVESLLQHRVDALAIVGLKHERATFEQLRRRAIPSVMLWNYRHRQPLPCLGVDNRQVGRLATDHLLQLGHREILFLFAGTHMNDSAADRQSGALTAMKAAGLDVPPKRRLACPYDAQGAKEIATSALRSGNRPTAIFSGNDVIAQGAIFAAMSLGIAVPDELSIAGIGDFRGSSAFEPGLTTVRIPALPIGSRAAEMLVGMIERPQVGPRDGERFAPDLLLRGSTARAD